MPERQTPKSCPVCALDAALRGPRDAHSATERDWPSLLPPELPLLHVQLAAFKRIKLWWPREPVLGLRIPWRLERSNCSWSSPKQASIGKISISHSFETPDKKTFSTLPLSRARVIAQDAIKQVANYRWQRPRKSFSLSNRFSNPVIIWWRAHILWWEGQRSYN